MATEQAQSVLTESDSLATWASWLAALVGLWVLVSPFVLSGDLASGTPLFSTFVAGLVILVLGAFAAIAIRTTTPGENTAGEIAGWLAALVGLWILVSPFVVGGAIGSGAAMYSTVVAGFLALVLAGYAGWEHAEAA